jgi:outer membrane protein OmpA-like peptidoglycan-associated protein
MKHHFLFALPIMAALALPVVAQQSTPATDQPSQTQATANPDQQLPPLKADTHQGFWGHLNPFARKKYVQKQLAPIRDRANELDELTAENSRNLKDVDTRATAGIQRADAHATLADQHAQDAASRAQTANQTAQQADTQLHTVSNVVENMDQYQSANTVEIRFRPGATMLSRRDKDALDQLADSMQNQKGWLIEVQGFSPGHGAASIQKSQRLADAVVRYLVIDHQIPVYRIHELGLGNTTLQAANGEEEHAPRHVSTVEVSVLTNGVGSLQANPQAAPAMSEPQQPEAQPGSQQSEPQQSEPQQ